MNIQEAKQRLPLPRLMAQLGFGKHAKQSAICPFHDDTKPSFSVYKNAKGEWRWKCHVDCGQGDEITFLEKVKGLTNAEAIRSYLEMAQKQNGEISKEASQARLKEILERAEQKAATYNGQAKKSEKFKGILASIKRGKIQSEWGKCVEVFSIPHIFKLAKLRGFSFGFVLWLKKRLLIGLYQGHYAFPVHEGGSVVAIHYRIIVNGKSTWRFHPMGCMTRPMVFGDPKQTPLVVVFESQWDAFAIMNKLDWHTKETPPFAVIATRGASNGKLIQGLVKPGSTLLAFTQNDKAGKKWLADICTYAGNSIVKSVTTPAAHKDLNDWTRAGATAEDIQQAIERAKVLHQSDKAKVWVEFCCPSELKNYIPPEGLILVGDCHITRGSVFVIGGAPGIGKSRSAVALAQAGAIQAAWFDLEIRRKFKTMILQNENGQFRLSKEFANLNCQKLDAWVRVCPPPPYGLTFEKEEFRNALKLAVDDFQPDVLILDPWNAAARDEKARDYLETFNLIRSILPSGDDSPAIGIVAHTRKPKADERATGRSLLNLLAGSYVLGSVPRSVFVMQAASDDPNDDRVVWTCCKNNDGELGQRTAWQRRNGLFAPITDFDWTDFDKPNQERRTITEADMVALFENGRSSLTKSEAVERLMENTGLKESACYDALKLTGRFRGHLTEENKLLSWKP